MNGLSQNIDDWSLRTLMNGLSQNIDEWSLRKQTMLGEAQDVLVTNSVIRQDSHCQSNSLIHIQIVRCLLPSTIEGASEKKNISLLTIVTLYNKV